MSKKPDYEISNSPTTVSINDRTMLVSFIWHDFPEGEKSLNAVVAKDKGLNTGISNKIGGVYQAAFLPHNYRGSNTPIPSIIEYIISNNYVSSLWFFVHEVDDGLIWFFVSDEYGHIDHNSDRVVHKDDFYDLLDEYLVVASETTTVFSSNFDLPTDFNGDIIESSISPHKIYDLIGTKKISYLGEKRILGMPHIFFFTSLLGILLTITYFSLSVLLSPIQSAKSHQNLTRIPMAKDGQEWNKIRVIMGTTFGSSFVSEYIKPTISRIPIDFIGWDPRVITFTPNSTKIVYTSSPESKVPLSIFSKQLFNSILRSGIKIDDFSIKNLTATPSRKEVMLDLPPIFIEKIAGFSSLDDYKMFLGEDIREERAVQAKQISKDYVGIKQRLMMLVNKYAQLNPFSLLYSKINGTYATDSQRLINLSNSLDRKRNQYNELLKEIKKPIVPSPEILASLTIKKGTIDDLFAFAKKTALIDIKVKRQQTKSGLILSTVFFKTIGVDNMLALINEVNRHLTLRITSVDYDWMTSEWKVSGSVYED